MQIVGFGPRLHSWQIEKGRLEPDQNANTAGPNIEWRLVGVSL